MAVTVGPQAFLRQQAATIARSDSRELLTRIACPTFVIHGTEDRLIPVAAGEEMAEGIATATLRLVEDAGHFLLLERPQVAAVAVAEFLGTIL